MKTFLLLLVLAAPLAAQRFEAGLNVSRQQYPTITELGARVEPQDKTVVTARLGYALVDWGPVLFQATAAYQPKAETDVRINGATSASRFGQEYWGVGAMFNFKALLAVGAGVEYRSEKLTLHGSGPSYGRPWARVNVGYAFPTPLVKPFIGLEAAAPLTKEDYNDSLGTDDTLKSLAPKVQIGIYGGIRF